MAESSLLSEQRSTTKPPRLDSECKATQTRKTSKQGEGDDTACVVVNQLWNRQLIQYNIFAMVVKQLSLAIKWQLHEQLNLSCCVYISPCQLLGSIWKQIHWTLYEGYTCPTSYNLFNWLSLPAKNLNLPTSCSEVHAIARVKFSWLPYWVRVSNLTYYS